MKRFVSVFLVLIVLNAVLLNCAINVFAENNFDVIWEQKLEYESTWLSDYHSGEDLPHYYLSFNAHPFYHLNFLILGYTPIADQLTVEVHDIAPTVRGDVDFLAIGDLGWVGLSKIVHFKEITELIERECMNPSQYQSGRFEIRSAWRTIIKEYGLTKEEFLVAYNRALEQDSSLQEALNLSDSEYNYHISGILRDISENPMPDFWIDALFWDVEAEAQMLLCKPGATYIPDFGYAVTAFDVFSGSFGMEPIEQLLSVDLTSVGVNKMIADTQDYLNQFGYDSWEYLQKSGTPSTLEMIQMIKTEREAQLAAKETGDASVTSVIVLALALPTLGAVVVAKKKRKI